MITDNNLKITEKKRLVISAYHLEKKHNLTRKQTSFLTGVNSKQISQLKFCIEYKLNGNVEEYKKAYEYWKNYTISINRVCKKFNISEQWFHNYLKSIIANEQYKYLAENDLLIDWDVSQLTETKDKEENKTIEFNPVVQRDVYSEAVTSNVNAVSKLNHIKINDLEFYIPSDKVCEDFLLMIFKKGLL